MGRDRRVPRANCDAARSGHLVGRLHDVRRCHRDLRIPANGQARDRTGQPADTRRDHNNQPGANVTMESSRPRITITPVEMQAVELPPEADPRRIGRKAAAAVALLVVLLLVVVLAPGLGNVRENARNASLGWIAVAIGLELLSCLSYVAMFRPIFCTMMSWRTASELAWAELGMGSIVPASGAGGLALGAWALSRGGMPGEVIARRSVAFFLIKSSVNFVAVAVVGVVIAVGVGPHESIWLSAVPAAAALIAIGAIAAVARLGVREIPTGDDVSRFSRAFAHARNALGGGVREAG